MNILERTLQLENYRKPKMEKCKNCNLIYVSNPTSREYHNNKKCKDRRN